MNRKDTEERKIFVYWWNMGSRTLDFVGRYKDYLLKKDIKIKEIRHPIHKEIKGLRFFISTSSTSVKLDTFGSDYIEEYNKAIQVFSTLMGDKTLFTDGYGREYKINWR